MKIINFSLKKLGPASVFGVILAAAVVSPSYSQATGTEGAGGAGAPGMGGTGAGTMEEGGAIQQAPSFREADKNGDHYVSKEELQGYPALLKRFDEVDAGKTGRLEEHEYGNLIMEKSREKGR